MGLETVNAFTNLYNNQMKVYGDAAKTGKINKNELIYLTIDENKKAGTTKDKTKGAGLGAMIDLAENLMDHQKLTQQQKADIFHAVYYRGMIEKEIGPSSASDDEATHARKMADPEVKKLNAFFDKYRKG